jgi:dolichyl-phosphate beta-glucosyltransferase
MSLSDAVELSIVIPCYKEGGKILHDLSAATSFLNHEYVEGEIIVVDDGSPDSTADIVSEFAKGDPRVHLVRYEQNRGKGYALRQGVAKSRGRWVMFVDAGLCVPYEYVRVPLKLLRESGCDMAIGSRALAESVIARHSPWYRKLGSQLFWILIRVFMGIPNTIRDTQCGFKFYDGPKARELFAKCSTDGFMIDIELICRALRGRWRIQNFPVEWSNDADTRFHPLFGSWRLLWDLFLIRMRILFGK